MKELRKRKPNRLAGYDYNRTGYYFLTLCVVERHPILRCRGAQCAPAVGLPDLSHAGKVTEQAICGIAVHYPHVSVEKYVIMPNHIHMILRIDHGRTLCAPTMRDAEQNMVARVVKHMKEYVTKTIGYSVWQKSYHDHIIRNEADYLRIWNYIETNPEKWREDRYYTEKEV